MVSSPCEEEKENGVKCEHDEGIGQGECPVHRGALCDGRPLDADPFALESSEDADSESEGTVWHQA